MIKKQRTGASIEAPIARPGRIGIVLKKFVLTKKYAPHMLDRCMKPYAAGQIIWNEVEIDELLSHGVPIKVYIEDVDGCAKG